MTQFDEWGEPITNQLDETEVPEEPSDENPPIETEPPDEDEPLIIGDWTMGQVIEYVTYHAIDNEDFLDNTTTNQVRFLNISRRTLARAFPGYTIPREAEYLFACVLNANYSDTTVFDKRGVASFSVEGISFTFKDWDKKDLSDLITKDVSDLIEEANPDADGGGQRGKVKWVTL